jgi:hypothetical protein
MACLCCWPLCPAWPELCLLPSCPLAAGAQRSCSAWWPTSSTASTSRATWPTRCDANLGMNMGVDARVNFGVNMGRGCSPHAPNTFVPTSWAQLRLTGCVAADTVCSFPSRFHRTPGARGGAGQDRRLPSPVSCGPGGPLLSLSQTQLSRADSAWAEAQGPRPGHVLELLC